MRNSIPAFLGCERSRGAYGELNCHLSRRRGPTPGRGRRTALAMATFETIAGWLSPQLRRGGTPYDLAESSMLLYVKEVLPVLKSCIWVCGGTRDGLSAGGKWIRTPGPSASESVFSR